MRFRIVGTPQAIAADGSASPLERRDAALLALLALAGPQSRARLAALLWPNAHADNARNNLRQRVHRLKRSTGVDAIAGDAVLSLHAACIEPLGTELQRLRDDCDAAPGELLGALDFDEEPELDGWVQMQRKHWRAARTDALAALADEHEARHELARALRYAQRLATEEPLLEHAHRRLMRLHYQRGDSTAALAAYATCVRALRDQLDVRPSPETETLRTLIAASVQALPAGAPVASLIPLPASLRRPPQLIGREAEWRQIEEAAAEGCTVLLEGEPGIGKTRLLQELAHARGWLAPVGGRPGDEAVPYALAARWLDALCERCGVPVDPPLAIELARLLPRMSDPQHPPFGVLEPARLLQAVEAVLQLWRPRAGDCPGLALDDLQFADGASLDLLLSLAAAGRASGYTWLLAFRANAQPPALRQWRERCEPGQTQHLLLAPLDEPAVAALLDSLQLPGLVPQAWAGPLLAHCGGHPFFIIDTLAALHARGVHEYSAGPRLPSHSAHRRAAITQRLEQMPSVAQQLAQVAAVAGQDFNVELAAVVQGCAPVALATPWRLLEQAGLFRSAGFAHDLVRQAAFDAVPQAIAHSLHRQIAGWLAGAPASASVGARIAAHWEAATDWRMAARAYEGAAREAHARSARREEVQALEAAARCHRAGRLPGSDDAAFDCEWQSLHLLLSLESSDEVLARTQSLLQRAATDRQRAAALEMRALAYGERYEPQAALDDAQAAEALAAALPTRLRLLIAQRKAGALIRLARPHEAVAVQQADLDCLDSLSDEERLDWFSDHALALDYADRRTEALRVYERAIEAAERLGHWSAASSAWGNKSAAHMYLNQLATSLHATERALDCGKRAGGERGHTLIDAMNLAGNLRDLGRFAEYLQRAEPLPQQLREAGYALWAFNAENDLAIGYLWLGRPELAHRALSPIPDDVAPVMHATRLFTQAKLLRGQRVPAGAQAPAQLVRRAQALIEAAGGTGRSYIRLRVALELARDEEPALALERVGAIEAEATSREQLMLATHALVLRTELLLQSGDVEGAAVAARQLTQRCKRDGPSPGLYAPHAWWLAHQSLAASDASLAASALDAAALWIDHTARQHVPEVFRRSFLERNPINAAVLRASAQRSPAPAATSRAS